MEAHYPAYAQITGSRVLSDPIKIVDGYNNDLKIVAGGEAKNVTIPAGIYSIDEVADALDDQLSNYTPPIIVGVTKDKTLSLQTEGVSSIDSLSGGASSLFYDYTLGNPPGMIIGTTDFPPGSKLTIQQGKNDKLIFYAGSDKKYEIDFPPGSYSKDDIINFINQNLNADGQDRIQAIPYGSDNIAITSDKYVISGLSGNMIELDGITSVIYDIAKYGNVYKTPAHYYGYADLSNGVQIQRGQNDTLNIQANNGPYQTINLLKDGENTVTLMPDELVDRLNSQFNSLGMNLTASITNGSLRIDSNLYGSTSNVNVDMSSPAYKSLFTRDYTYYYDPWINNGVTQTASVTGNYGIGDTTVIDSSNNKMTMTVDGTTKTLLLQEGSYSKTDLATEMNNELTSAGFNVTASLIDGGNGESALSLRYNQAGSGSISVSNDAVQSTAFPTLFDGTAPIYPSYASGATGAPQYPPEGVAGDPIIPTTPATVQGAVDLTSGITLTDSNNVLTYTLNGKTTSVTLATGFYTNQQLVDQLNKQLDPNELSASLTSDRRYLVLASTAQGNGNYFQNVSGP